MERMYNSINVSNSAEMVIAKQLMINNFPDDFDGAVNFMSQQVAQIFASSILQSQGRKRRVSEMSRGGRGRHGGRGRGRGRGRARGNRDGGNGNNARNGNTVMNGVDVSDIRRSFTDDEWNRMGAAGRSFVRTQREFHNNRDGGRGRGRSTSGRGRRGDRTLNQIRTATEDNTRAPNVVDHTNSQPSSVTTNISRGGRSGLAFGQNS